MEQHFTQLLFILVIVTSECRVVSSVTETVSASKEEDVTLSCLNSTLVEPKSCYRVRWIKHGAGTSQEKVLSLWPKKVSADYHAQGESDIKGQSRLFLTKLQKSDEGRYSCEIWRGWDLLHIRNISLKVKDCKALPPVEAEPSTPVHLSCPFNTTLGQQGLYNVSWAKLRGDHPMSVDSNRVEMNGTSLLLQSVNTTDSAWYRCSYMYGQTWRCFDIKLLVQVKHAFTTIPVIATQTQQVTANQIAGTDEQERSNDVLAAVVASVISGIILIAALAGLFIYRRRRDNQRARLQPQMLTTGCIEDGYEPLNLVSSRDAQKVNSIYRFPDESLHTFRL
ncbi:uncharacterized protein LOC114448618 isoform X2 [Parambassis ranga]|uniref:Uncharacterized protein LOC114448618 isoform X2 n=1 Tax=Parambassis ranga TaxID=210632 RepID=A0A6P7K167_9TELE|nr:uncharacterized protein LOC114448618 isoform X2 [Parambassis ranga]